MIGAVCLAVSAHTARGAAQPISVRVRAAVISRAALAHQAEFNDNVGIDACSVVSALGGDPAGLEFLHPLVRPRLSGRPPVCPPLEPYRGIWFVEGIDRSGERILVHSRWSVPCARRRDETYVLTPLTGGDWGIEEIRLTASADLACQPLVPPATPPPQ
jgi:hypothetical protein